jgi:hypothetical protein
MVSVRMLNPWHSEGFSFLGHRAQQGMSNQATTRMSIMETRQDVLERKMSEVIATTAANTEALHELKHVFTKYMSRFKDNSEGSPSVSKSAVDSDIPLVIKAVKCNATSDLPLSKKQRDHVIEALPNQGENVTSVEGSLQPTRVPQPPK